MDGVPPPTRWEIPRTPVQQLQAATAYQSSVMLPDDAAGSSSIAVSEERESRPNEDAKRSPVPFPDPPLPRRFGNETVPDLDRRATTVLESEEPENGIGSAMSAEDRATVSTSTASPKPVATHNTSTGPVMAVHYPSPPISADKGGRAN